MEEGCAEAEGGGKDAEDDEDIAAVVEDAVVEVDVEAGLVGDTDGGGGGGGGKVDKAGHECSSTTRNPGQGEDNAGGDMYDEPGSSLETLKVQKNRKI